MYEKEKKGVNIFCHHVDLLRDKLPVSFLLAIATFGDGTASQDL